MSESVVLVDRLGNEIGFEDKIKAHEDALLHKAFSIQVYNSKGELLLQRRAKNKYHCPRLWSNTCCSHPRPNESMESATYRRLIEEMGFFCLLKPAGSFIYKAVFDNDLTEYEHDHVFVGISEETPIINTDEVEEYKWISKEELKEEIEQNPEKYTPWFKVIFEQLES